MFKGGKYMIAEIKGKISQTGSNLSERIEDNLTGNFFGALRYVPFDLALREILSKGIFPKKVGDLIGKINQSYWKDNISFWPYHREGEIDVLLDFEHVTMGVEVKYLSGLSSDDDIGISNEIAEQIIQENIQESRNQLARESRIVAERGQGKTKILIFIATNPSCSEIYHHVINRNPPIIEKDVLFGYISWQSILNEMNRLNLHNPFYQTIIEDLILLLLKKGFESFKDMDVKFDGEVSLEEFYRFNEIRSAYSFINYNLNYTVEKEGYYEFS